MSRFAILMKILCRPATGGQFLDLVSVEAAKSVLRKCDVRENAV